MGKQRETNTSTREVNIKRCAEAIRAGEGVKCCYPRIEERLKSLFDCQNDTTCSKIGAFGTLGNDFPVHRVRLNPHETAILLRTELCFGIKYGEKD